MILGSQQNWGEGAQISCVHRASHAVKILHQSISIPYASTDASGATYQSIWALTAEAVSAADATGTNTDAARTAPNNLRIILHDLL